METAAAPAEKSKDKKSSGDENNEPWNDDDAWGEFEREEDEMNFLKPVEAKKTSSELFSQFDVKKTQQHSSIDEKKKNDEFLNES